MSPQDDSFQSDLEVSELLERVDNDRELLRELLDIFKQDTPRHLNLLRNAVDCMDVRRVASEAHTLKGMLANLSAKPAAAAAAGLERLAREGKSAEFANSFATLEQQLQRLMPEVESCLAGVCP